MKKTVLVLILLALALALQATAAHAKSKKSKKGKKGEDKELDISQLKSQYWKAHDKQFEVIQNKKFTKAGKIEVTPMFGIYQRVSFQDTQTIGASVAYHFNDMWGAEFRGYKMLNSDSNILTRFKETRGATIEFNEERYFMGGSVLFSPIYGKFSFLGKKISHYDLYLAPGGGVVKTVKMRPAYHLGVGQKFWLSRSWALRVEYMWQRYEDEVATEEGITAKKNGGTGFFEDSVTNQNLIFGISFMFN